MKPCLSMDMTHAQTDRLINTRSRDLGLTLHNEFQSPWNCSRLRAVDLPCSSKKGDTHTQRKCWSASNCPHSPFLAQPFEHCAPHEDEEGGKFIRGGGEQSH